VEDFLREYYSFLTKAVEIIAAITAIIVYKKYKNTSVKYFLWFLIYVFFLELIGGYTVYVAKYEFLSNIKAALKGTWAERNYWWYAIFWGIGSVLFYSTYFMTIIKTRAYKKIIGWFRLLFLISAIIYIIVNFDRFFVSSMKFNLIFGAFVILVTTTFYFVDVLQSERLLSFYKSVNFYIAAVIFIWYLVLTPIIFYDVYYSTVDWDYVILKSALYLSMNIFMYLTFTIVLLWCKPQNV